jgi:hypothetical protein
MPPIVRFDENVPGSAGGVLAGLVTPQDRLARVGPHRLDGPLCTTTGPSTLAVTGDG